MNTEMMLKDLGSWEAVDLMIDGLDSCLLKHLLYIKVSLEENDYAALKIHLHSLKGAALYIHCEELERVTHNFESAIVSGRYEQIPEYYPLLVEDCIKLRKEIRKYIIKRDGTLDRYSPAIGGILEDTQEGEFEIPICRGYELVDLGFEIKLRQQEETVCVLDNGNNRNTETCYMTDKGVCHCKLL